MAPSDTPRGAQENWAQIPLTPEQLEQAKREEAQLQAVAEQIVGRRKFTAPKEQWASHPQYQKIEPVRCPNCPYGGPIVGGRGDTKADLVIVGESPGFEEGRLGIPFVGPSGEVLNSAIPPGLPVLLTNALQCRPIGKTGKSDKKLIAAVQACSPRLFEQILSHPRKAILALGNTAMWSLTGDYSTKITQIRGKKFNSRLCEGGVVACVHPAFLLRGSGSYIKFKDDVKRAIDLSKGIAPEKYVTPYYVVYDYPGLVQDLVRYMLQLPWDKRLLGADIETDGFDRKGGHILSLAICWDARHVHIVPGDLVHWLAPIFEPRHGFQFIWHNGKFDCGFLRRQEYIGQHARVHEDTMLLSYALNEARGFHDLETVANDIIGAPDYKYIIQDILKALPKDQRSYANVPRPVLYEYQSLDVSNTFQCFFDLRDRVRKDHHLEKLYTKTLIPVSELLLRVELMGIPIDTWMIKENQERLEQLINAQRDKIQKEAGAAINPNSPKQMVPFLYNRLKLRTKHRTTDKGTLEKIKDQHPIIAQIMEYRKHFKANSTYAKGFWKYVKHTPLGTYVFPTYLIHGTRTGRLSSRDPNMQNIPRDDKLRGMFTASGPNRILMEVDLNQAELRVLAALSGDPVLCRIYSDPNAPSIHDNTAEKMFGDLYKYANDKVAKNEMKMKAKNVNFGIPYGIQAAGLADQTKSSTADAQKWLDDWAREYNVAWKFLERCGDAPARGESIITVFGRKKRFGVVAGEALKSLQNEAKNMPEQSIANDFNLHGAMKLEFSGFLARRNAWIVNLIHDAILIDVPLDYWIMCEIAEEACRVMERVPVEWGITRVPFKAEASVGYRWGKAHMLDMHAWKKIAEACF